MRAFCSAGFQRPLATGKAPLASLLLCLLAALLLVGGGGCALMPAAPRATTPAPAPQPPAPVRSADAEAADRLVALWRSQGLKVEASYEQVSAKPADRIEWKALSVVLAQDADQMDVVMASVGQFAARATQPVVIHLYARTRKQDAVLSQALKKGAVASGGRNSSVRLEHHIHPDYAPRVEVTAREGTQ